MDRFSLQVPRHVPRFQEFNKDLLPLLRPKSLKTLYSTQSEHPQGVFLSDVLLRAVVSCCVLLRPTVRCSVLVYAIVVTVFVLQSSLSSFLPAPPQPPNAFPSTRTHNLESESQCMSSCVCLYHKTCVSQALGKAAGIHCRHWKE